MIRAYPLRQPANPGLSFARQRDRRSAITPRMTPGGPGRAVIGSPGFVRRHNGHAPRDDLEGAMEPLTSTTNRVLIAAVAVVALWAGFAYDVSRPADARGYQRALVQAAESAHDAAQTAA